MLFNINGRTQWSVGWRTYDIGIFEHCIPENSFFSTMQSSQIPSPQDENGGYIINDENTEDFILLCAFLNGGDQFRLNHAYDVIETLMRLLDKYACDTNNLEYEASRWLHLNRENWIRDSMYQLEYEDHLMNTCAYYALGRADSDTSIQNMLAYDSQYTEVQSNKLLFADIDRPQVQSWESVQKTLAKIDFLADIPGVFIAGGYLFAALYGTEAPDIDVFIYRTEDGDLETDDGAMKKVNEIIETICNYSSSDSDSMSFTRTKYALTITGAGVVPIQIIFRIYNSPSEVLHGFDVDSCCLGYKDGKVWYSGRASNALRAGFNTVDFDRMSPSYEYRLVKYAIRGMAIHVPHMNKNRIDLAVLDTYVHEGGWCKKTNLDSRYRNAHRNLHGLNLILFLEAYYMSNKRKKVLTKSFIKLAHEHSDYSPLPFYTVNPSNGCTTLHAYIQYLMQNENADKYPDHYPRYMKHLHDYHLETTVSELNIEHVMRGYDYDNPEIEDVWINNFLASSAHGRILFLKTVRKNRLSAIMNINEHLYAALAVPGKWEISRTVEFKRIRPGEQATSSFHKIVLDDPKKWYDGLFYV